MSLPSMIATTALAIAGLSSTTSTEAVAESFIGRQTPTLVSDRMTPEALWAMGRIGTVAPNSAGTHAVYSVSYYSVPENKSHSVLYLLDLEQYGCVSEMKNASFTYPVRVAVASCGA